MKKRTMIAVSQTLLMELKKMKKELGLPTHETVIWFLINNYARQKIGGNNE